MFFGEITRSEKRRIADDGIRVRPRSEERVGAYYVVIKIVQRQVFLKLQRMSVAAG